MPDPNPLLVEAPAQVRALAASARRVAVLGMRPETHADRPAFYVPKALFDAGVAIFPVPTQSDPPATILGQPTHARVADIAPAVDIVVVFRRPEDLPAHLDDLRAARPRCIWLQSGIRHEAVAAALVEAGIAVVQDRCLMVEHRAARAAT
jgi:predicted CoA-binding protein